MRARMIASTGVLLTLCLFFSSWLPAQVPLDSAIFGGLRARPIGPAVMSGRITSLDAVAEDPLTIYVGSAGGGVWKSDDGGIVFRPVFDEHTMSIGAVRIDPSDPKTVWVGTGESWVRNTVSVGDGVYRTADGGKTWQHKGLADTERIARIQVDPRKRDTVYVCATGHLWNSNPERGVFKTTDGGENWERVLYVDEDTGCSDLSLDPQDPNILYAGMWQFRRWPWSFKSGGPGSGLYRSKDGGTTWAELKTGLPEGEKGRIAVAVAPSRPSTVYAVVESSDTALYRSDDLGEHWERLNASFNIGVRPFYFAYIVVDPTNHLRVFKPGFTLTFSEDGGKSFTSPFSSGLSGPSIHSDLHGLWINPRNPHELIVGTDGGVYFSYDRGANFRLSKALPVSQFYVVSYDMEVPYNVYGGLQDNGTWMGPSSSPGGVQARDWANIGGGDGFHAYVDPREPDIVYVESQGGNLQRRRRSTGESKSVRPYAEEEGPKLRFNWNTPIHLSSSRAGILYVGSQYLFRSRDRGDSWERISPDLTSNDPEKQRQHESGGLTIDNSTAENHTTIYTISESPLNPEVIWVGTDDGNLQVTRDGGGSWSNVASRVSGVPAQTWVSRVTASRFEEGTAYVTFDGHRSGDMKTYVVRTRDFGRTWESLASDAIEGFAHVVLEDLENPDLLFLGTEFGLFISADGGLHWARFESGFPRAAVLDLAIHPRDHDLIIATHGRGIWILDDLTPLRALSPEVLEADLVLLPTRPARMTLSSGLQEFPGDDEFVGQNPSEAASIVYYQKRRHIFGDLRVEVYDAQGERITTLQGGKLKGINRVDWPMRLPPPRLPPATVLVPVFQGPRVMEGNYSFKLIKGKQTYQGEVALVADPRSRHSTEDRLLQQRTALELYSKLEGLSYLVDSLVDLRDQSRQRGQQLGEKDGQSFLDYAEQLDEFRKTLVATSESGMLSGEEQLREELSELFGAVNGYEGRPTGSELKRKTVLLTRLQSASEHFDELTAPRRLEELNRALQGTEAAPLELLSREAWEKRRQTGR